MSFVNLQSIEGREALQRALESPSVLRIAGGRLDVRDVESLKEVEAHAAFQLIRWPDSKGEPTCPRCNTVGAYHYVKKSVFSCKECRHQFTVTSGTILSSRKMPLRNYLFGLAI